MDCDTQLPQKRFLLKKTDKFWSLYDLVSGIIAASVGFCLTPWSPYISYHQYWWLIALFGVFVFIAARTIDLPNPSNHSSSKGYEIVVFSLMAVVLAVMGIAIAQLIFSYELIGRYVVAITTLSGWVFLCGGRLICEKLLKPGKTRVVLFGSGDLAKSMYERLSGHNSFKPIAFWDPCNACVTAPGELPLISANNLEQAAEQLNSLRAQIIIICVDDNDPISNDLQRLLVDLPLHGFYILNKGAFIEKYFAEISAEYMSFHWTTSFFALSASSQTFMLKRFIDICLSLFGLCLTLPFYPFIALAIKLDSKGVIFFRQKRVGYLGKHFDIFKFRTMASDAEKNGAQWASKNDSRVTRLGKFMRLSRIDELPQLWNVLRGDMSIVGPRPERPEFVTDLMQEIPYYERRHLVPPGLTGWAQICYRYGASKDDARKKLQFDLYYIKHLSILLDIKIILKTLPMIAKGSR